MIGGSLERIEEYLDATPRTGADAEDVGPFTLFRSRSASESYYARPRRGLDRPVRAEDVEGLAERCRQVGLPVNVEGLLETTPTLVDAVRAAGLTVTIFPLLCLAPGELRPEEAAPGTRLRRIEGADLAFARAVAEVAFTAGGTCPGPDGIAERDARASTIAAERLDAIRQRARDGYAVTWGAFTGEQELVAMGLHQPVATATEIVSVSTLPAFRGRGFAGAVTTALVRDAFSHGIDLVLLAAQDDAVARIYERLGFRRVGHAVSAEP